jgi:hypothetical protein
MRTYIFTDLERRVLNEWLSGALTQKDMRVQRVLSRVRLFSTLASDIDLFMRVRSRLAKPESAVST